MPTVLHKDAFSAVMLASEPLNVSIEQQDYIKAVLAKACSDSRFAEKAYLAIWRILTAGPVVPPVVSSLNPATVVLGSPSFDIHVMGTGFTGGSVIVFNGFDEPTTFVSETELTTGVNMDVWAAPAVVPIAVRSEDGVLSDAITFEFTESAPLAAMAASKAAPAKPVTATAMKK